MTPPYFKSIAPLVPWQKLYEYTSKEEIGVNGKQQIFVNISECLRHCIDILYADHFMRNWLNDFNFNFFYKWFSTIVKTPRRRGRFYGSLIVQACTRQNNDTTVWRLYFHSLLIQWINSIKNIKLSTYYEPKNSTDIYVLL